MIELKKIFKSKAFWGVIVTILFVNQIFSANKDSSQDLLADYYNKPIDTAKNIEEIIIPELTKFDSLTEFAQTLLGKSYVYGRSGPDAFDCSGFIYHVFKKYNIDLPRSSKYQAKEGEVISREEIRKGDLLFFKSPTPNNPNIGHVGITIENNDGNIKFIHSSTGRGVVIDSLGSKHYGRRFIEARRLLN